MLKNTKHQKNISSNIFTHCSMFIIYIMYSIIYSVLHELVKIINAMIILKNINELSNYIFIINT